MDKKEYIERGALIEMLNSKSDMAMGTPKAVFANAAKMVELMPAADVVKVVHGTWTLNKDGSGTCNQCGTTQKNVWDYNDWQNYCGCCGARMDGERKEQT